MNLHPIGGESQIDRRLGLMMLELLGLLDRLRAGEVPTRPEHCSVLLMLREADQRLTQAWSQPQREAA